MITTMACHSLSAIQLKAELQTTIRSLYMASDMSHVHLSRSKSLVGHEQEHVLNMCKQERNRYDRFLQKIKEISNQLRSYGFDDFFELFMDTL